MRLIGLVLCCLAARLGRRLVAFAVLLIIALGQPTTGSAALTHLDQYSARDDVLRWVDEYRHHPDPAGVPNALRILSQRGGLRDPDASGVYVGFLAGVLATNPAMAEPLIGKVLDGVSAEDNWIVVRAIAYSGLPQWKELLRSFAPRMPMRTVMIERYLAGRMPTLDQMHLEGKKPAWTEKLNPFASSAPKHAEMTFESNPDLLDTLWGCYFATGSYQPVSRIIVLLPWSKDRDDIERLTVGNMAKYTLATNATRNMDLLAMLKRASQHQPKEVVPILNEVIEAAQTLEIGRIRQDALAAIDELKAKGPGFKRDVSFWGKVGEGTLALGCIVAAATGQIEVGLPCVIGGAASSAALQGWDSQK